MTSSVKYHKVSTNVADGDVELTLPSSDETISPLQEAVENTANTQRTHSLITLTHSLIHSYLLTHSLLLLTHSLLLLTHSLLLLTHSLTHDRK